MVDFYDLSKWLNRPELQPENMTALLVLLAQGKFVGEDLLPVVPSPDDFMWLTEAYNDKFSLNRKRGERGKPQIKTVQDSQLTASCEEYFVAAQITDKMLRRGNIYSFVNILTRNVSLLAENLRMNVEKDTIAALMDTTTYSTINTHSCSTAFSTYATSDPIKDLELAKTEIATSEFVTPDTLVIGAMDKTHMTLSDSIRDTIQYTRDYTEEGILKERIAGLDIMEANAVYQSGSSFISILSGNAIVLKRGIAGEIRESQPYMADSAYDKTTKVLTLLASRVFKPIVIRPQAITKVSNVS